MAVELYTSKSLPLKHLVSDWLQVKLFADTDGELKLTINILELLQQVSWVV